MCWKTAIKKVNKPIDVSIRYIYIFWPFFFFRYILYFLRFYCITNFFVRFSFLASILVILQWDRWKNRVHFHFTVVSGHTFQNRILGPKLPCPSNFYVPSPGTTSTRRACLPSLSTYRTNYDFSSCLASNDRLKSFDTPPGISRPPFLRPSMAQTQTKRTIANLLWTVS